MYKLLSLSDDPWSLEKFGACASRVGAFLDENGLHGLELMRWHDPQAGALPLERVVGRHMPFWPIWLDFWNRDEAALLAQFETLENRRGYYMADSLEEFIAQRREELLDTQRMGAQYAVFHVSHAQLKHCYDGNFTYTDRQVIDAFADMINQTLAGAGVDFMFLFENHWFPGLTLLEPELAMRLLERVAHPNKGFVLDISHMMNALGERDERSAVRRILGVLDGFGEAKKHIRAIHLNSSAPRTLDAGAFDPSLNYYDRLIAAMRYVGRLDPHAPFSDPIIARLVERIEPLYLVHELAGDTLPALGKAVIIQNTALASINS